MSFSCAHSQHSGLDCKCYGAHLSVNIMCDARSNPIWVAFCVLCVSESCKLLLSSMGDMDGDVTFNIAVARVDQIWACPLLSLCVQSFIHYMSGCHMFVVIGVSFFICLHSHKSGSKGIENMI